MSVIRIGDRVQLSLHMRRLLCRGLASQRRHLLAIVRQTGTVMTIDYDGGGVIHWDDSTTDAQWCGADPYYRAHEFEVVG